jgi:hypothetical protein
LASSAIEGRNEEVSKPSQIPNRDVDNITSPL